MSSYTFNGMLLCNKKEESADTCYAMDEPQKHYAWASLVAQWLRVCLLMRGTRVRALVWEDPTCQGAAGSVGHNC